ncbi:unnamed protein product, partial [Timema podura]|nr:unnamed protein product [Timema podura]
MSRVYASGPIVEVEDRKARSDHRLGPVEVTPGLRQLCYEGSPRGNTGRRPSFEENTTQCQKQLSKVQYVRHQLYI